MKQAENLKGFRGECAGLFNLEQDIEGLIGKENDESFYATSCAYLIRRFGPSRYGCDSYKDLISYILTTEMEGVYLIVAPGCSVSTSFGYYLTEELYEKVSAIQYETRNQRSEPNPQDCKIQSSVIKALCDAIEELKKPVNVRDWHFNIAGRVPDGDLQYDKDEDVIGIAEYSKFAGYGITPDYYDKFNTKE